MRGEVEGTPQGLRTRRHDMIDPMVACTRAHIPNDRRQHADRIPNVVQAARATAGCAANSGKIDVASAVYTEQVNSLYRQVPIALSVNLVNVALVTIVLTPLATRPLLLPWFISVMLVTTGRGMLWLRYRHAVVQPENTRRWARLATWGSLLAGPSWGVGGIVLFPVVLAPGQLFLIIVMGGMCAGALAISASHLPSLLAFVLPTGLPMALRFFAQGSTTDTALAAMTIVFVAALSLAGRHLSRSLRRGAPTARLGGLHRDANGAANLDAVTNALTEGLSNGQTEGHINRLKTLKRAFQSVDFGRLTGRQQTTRLDA